VRPGDKRRRSAVTSDGRIIAVTRNLLLSNGRFLVNFDRHYHPSF
jgi:hypothetical protein